MGTIGPLQQKSRALIKSVLKRRKEHSGSDTGNLKKLLLRQLFCPISYDVKFIQAQGPQPNLQHISYPWFGLHLHKLIFQNFLKQAI